MQLWLEENSCKQPCWTNSEKYTLLWEFGYDTDEINSHRSMKILEGKMLQNHSPPYAANMLYNMSLKVNQFFMNLVKSLSPFLLLLLLAVSCKKEDIPIVECSNATTDIAKAKIIIVSKWTWAYERFLDRISQIYVFKTPQTEGYTWQYEFLKKGDVKIYRNQNLIETATYEITTLDVVTGSSFDNNKTILLLKNKSTGQRIDFAPITICNDTLTLNYQAYLDTKGQEKWSKN